MAAIDRAGHATTPLPPLIKPVYFCDTPSLTPNTKLDLPNSLTFSPSSIYRCTRKRGCRGIRDAIIKLSDDEAGSGVCSVPDSQYRDGPSNGCSDALHGASFTTPYRYYFCTGRQSRLPALLEVVPHETSLVTRDQRKA